MTLKLPKFPEFRVFGVCGAKMGKPPLKSDGTGGTRHFLQRIGKVFSVIGFMVTFFAFSTVIILNQEQPKCVRAQIDKTSPAHAPSQI